MPAIKASTATLFILASGFVLSQAFRTVGAVLAVPLTQAFGLDAWQLGLWAAAFHLTFGVLQLPLGVALDAYGPRRVVVAVFPLAAIGAAVCALTPSYGGLILGQALIGIGCGPAFLACMVYITQHFKPDRFTFMSGLVMSFSNVGILATATPLAWLMGHIGWRGGYAVLGLFALVAWVLIVVRVREGRQSAGHGLSFRTAFRELGPLLRMPHTKGLLALTLVSYSAFITLRGLWMGPMLHERHGLGLIEVGNAAIAVTLAGMAAPSLFASFDRGAAARVRLLTLGPLACTALFVLLAYSRSLWIDLGVPVLYALLAGYSILQYSYARSAYPAEAIGRAMSLVNTAMFVGVALMQALTGVVANGAAGHGIETFEAAYVTEAVTLLLGALAFAWLPQAKSRERVATAS